MISHLTMQTTRGLTLPTRGGPASGSSLPLRELGEIGLIIGVSVALVGILAVLIKLTHGRRKRKRHSAGPPTAQRAPQSAPITTQSRRKGRREHRPRNPTLAETGGLPPIRDPNPPSPAN